MKLFSKSSSVLTLALLSACGGGGGSGGITGGSGGTSSNSVIITGNAGSGASIVDGNVEVKCATGTGTATTAADGSYSVSITGGVAPCILRVTSADNRFQFHSSVDAFASGVAMANITPLTEMVVAKALAAAPADAFSSGVSTTISNKLTATNLDNAVVAVQQALPALGVNLGSINPVKDSLQTDSGAGGNAQDKAIDGLMLGLASANKTVADLTNLMVTAQTSTAATQALTSFAATNAIASSTLNGCPFARSGKYLMAGPTDRFFTMIDVDFTTLQGSFKRLNPTIADAARTAQQISINQPDPTNVPCRFNFVAGGGAASVLITSSGVGVFSKTPSNVFPTNEFFGPITGAAGTGNSSNFLGLALPVQRIVPGQFDGNFKGIAFYKATSDSFYKVDFNKTQVSGSTLTGYKCSPASGACSNTADSTETLGAADDDYNNYGIYTSRSSPNSAYLTKSALFRTAQGDKIAVSLIYGTGIDSALAIATNRSTSMPAPVVNASASNYTWLVLNGTGSNAGNLYQKSYQQTFTIRTVNGNTVTRSDAAGEVHTMAFNSPAPGMYRLSAGSSGTPAALGITIAGLTIFSSTDPNATNASDHFFGVAARY